MLPTVAAQVPRPATTSTSPFANAMFEPIPTAHAQSPKRRSGFRRSVTWLLVLAIIGGLAYAGFTYGPELIEKYTGADENNGPAAPLVFPMPIAPPVAVRECNVHRRRTRRVRWHTELRGDSRLRVRHHPHRHSSHGHAGPRDPDPLGSVVHPEDRRTDVVHAASRRLAPSTSRWAAADGSARSTNSCRRQSARSRRSTRQPSHSWAPSRPVGSWCRPTPPGSCRPRTAATTPTADGSPPPAPPLPPGITVQPGLDGVEDPTMEIWVDDTGIVRKSIMSPQLGGETITVTSVSGDPFQPVFPTPDAVSPLTAEVLFRLGL